MEPFRPGVAQPERFERAGLVAVGDQPRDWAVQVRAVVLGCWAEPERAGAGFVVAPVGEHLGQADLDAADGQVEVGDIPRGAGAVETGQGHGDIGGHQLHPGLPEPADPLPEDLPGDAEPLVGGGGQQAGQFTEQAEDVAGPLRREEGQGTTLRGGRPDALAGDDGAITQAHDQPGQETAPAGRRHVPPDQPDQMFGAAGVGGGDEGREETLVAEGAQPPPGVDVGEQRQQGGFVEDQGVVGELGKKLRRRQRRFPPQPERLLLGRGGVPAFQEFPGQFGGGGIRVGGQRLDGSDEILRRRPHPAEGLQDVAFDALLLADQDIEGQGGQVVVAEPVGQQTLGEEFHDGFVGVRQARQQAGSLRGEQVFQVQRPQPVHDGLLGGGAVAAFDDPEQRVQQGGVVRGFPFPQSHCLLADVGLVPAEAGKGEGVRGRTGLQEMLLPARAGRGIGVVSGPACPVGGVVRPGQLQIQGDAQGTDEMAEPPVVAFPQQGSHEFLHPVRAPTGEQSHCLVDDVVVLQGGDRREIERRGGLGGGAAQPGGERHQACIEEPGCAGQRGLDGATALRQHPRLRRPLLRIHRFQLLDEVSKAGGFRGHPDEVGLLRGEVPVSHGGCLSPRRRAVWCWGRSSVAGVRRPAARWCRRAGW